MTKADGRTKRRRAFRFGLHSETLTAWMLRLKGYRILARRFRTPAGEIDIVAARASLLVFLEIKARAERDAAATALTARQRTRIERASALFVARHPALSSFRQRFDMVLVQPWRWPVHLKDAWRPGF